MAIPDYDYKLEQCDVHPSRRGSLGEYRVFRRKCLEYMRGDTDTSVMNQVHDLAWNTAVFQTLNESRRLEPGRSVNGTMWELLTAGYANLMTMGIRKLVDRHKDTDSVWNVIVQLERRPELLTREHFVCYDGVPYDHADAYRKYIASLDPSAGPTASWVSTKGPDAWSTSEMLHEAFDALSGYPSKPTRADKVLPGILTTLKDALAAPSIQTVCTLADKRVAHAERLSATTPVPTATFNDIHDALGTIVKVANFLSTRLFYDATFGAVVPVPQFNVLEHLDSPWALPENMPALHAHWQKTSEAMDRWAYDAGDDYLPGKPGAA